MFSSEAWLSNSGEFYNGVATQSLRLDSASTSYLYDTASGTESSTANRAISFWFKRSQVDVAHTILTGFVSGPTVKDFIQFRSDNTLRVLVQQSSASNQTRWTTDQVFRDTSAWYHIFIKYALGESSNADKVKIYVNGSLVDTDGGVATGANVTSSQLLTSGTTIRIGTYSNATLTVNGYLSEFNLIDGTADFDDFGELKNGVWIPIEYTGDYGNSGFRLQFNQTGTGTGSTTTIGADTGGNLKHFDSTGIDTEDCDMPDSPENGFATLNSTIRPYTVTPAETVSDGNLNAFFNSSAVSGSYWSTFLLTSGKWYFEVLIDAVGSNANVGISNNPDASGRGTYTAPANGYGYFYKMTGEKGINNTFTSYGATYTTNDIIGCAFDLDNDTITFYKNNVSQGQITGVAPYDANNRGFIPALTGFNGVRSVINFGQDSSFAGNETAQGNTDANGIGDFYYSPPSGYIALCTSNLPEPTISPNAGDGKQADDYFNTVIYDGNDDATRTFDVGFVSDFSWFKARSGAGYAHQLYDSVRGVQLRLRSNTSDAEATNSEGVLDFDDNGLLKIGTDAFLNESGTTMVIWNWKAGGTAVSNTDGTITSSVSANTDAGFSIVSFTGNGSNDATIGHGLGTTPAMIITKNRTDSVSWRVWHQDLTSTYVLLLNGTQAETAPVGQSNGYIKTVGSSTYSVYQGNVDTNGVNGSGDAMIAYCFAEIEGYSKFGSYNSNSSADGPMIYLGFRPKWVLIKKIDGAASWWLVDAVRDTYNPTDSYILPDTSDADRTYTTADFLSNGFKIRNTSTAFNSGTHIYMAFAENPFKYANAR